MKIYNETPITLKAAIEPKNFEELKEIIEYPLLYVCEILYKKNIKTWFSSCTPYKQKGSEPYTAILGIMASSLSDENLRILKKLQQEFPENFYKSARYGQEYIYGENPYILIYHQFNRDIKVEEVSNFFENITNDFLPQQLIEDNKLYKKTNLIAFQEKL